MDPGRHIQPKSRAEKNGPGRWCRSGSQGSVSQRDCGCKKDTINIDVSGADDVQSYFSQDDTMPYSNHTFVSCGFLNILLSLTPFLTIP